MPGRRFAVILVALCCGVVPVRAADLTPPVQPQIQATPVPPPVVLPPPTEAQPPDVPIKPLTAEDAALLALRHQPSLTVAQSQVLAAQGFVQQAKSALGPSVGTEASYTYSTSGSSIGLGGGSGTGTATVNGVSPSGWLLSATVRQLIWDFDHSLDLVRQASAQERSAGAGLTMAQSDLVYSVKEAFYSLAQDLRLVAVAQDNLKNQQAHLALAQARLNAGIGVPLDVVQAQTAVDDAIFSLTQAQNNALLARVSLADLIGVDPRTPLQPADSSEPSTLGDNIDQLNSAALAQRPEVLQAQESVTAAVLGLDAARNSNAPVISGSVGWQDHDPHFPPDMNSLAAGVALQWTPFDSGLTEGRVTVAQAGVEAAQAELVSARLGVLSDVSQAYLNLHTAEQGVVTAQAELVNAQEALRLAEGRYRAGIGVFLDVLDAQAALVVANTNQVNALTAVEQARAALAHAINADPAMTLEKR
jgi:outer membrane protein